MNDIIDSLNDEMIDQEPSMEELENRKRDAELQAAIEAKAEELAKAEAEAEAERLRLEAEKAEADRIAHEALVAEQIPQVVLWMERMENEPFITAIALSKIVRLDPDAVIRGKAQYTEALVKRNAARDAGGVERKYNPLVPDSKYVEVAKKQASVEAAKKKGKK